MSPGQADLSEEVIIAKMEWPDWRLNFAALRTSDGRRLLPGPSVKGNDTTTISHGLQTTECLVVFGAIPFLERAGDGPMPG